MTDIYRQQITDFREELKLHHQNIQPWVTFTEVYPSHASWRKFLKLNPEAQQIKDSFLVGRDIKLSDGQCSQAVVELAKELGWV